MKDWRQSPSCIPLPLLISVYWCCDILQLDYQYTLKKTERCHVYHIIMWETGISQPRRTSYFLLFLMNYSHFFHINVWLCSMFWLINSFNSFALIGNRYTRKGLFRLVNPDTRGHVFITWFCEPIQKCYPCYNHLA